MIRSNPSGAIAELDTDSSGLRGPRLRTLKNRTYPRKFEPNEVVEYLAHVDEAIDPSSAGAR